MCAWYHSLGMKMTTISLGPTPLSEACAQTTDENYGIKAVAECEQYIKVIRREVGEEPDGARLGVRRHAHDFGEYYDVGLTFDPDNLNHWNYAENLESRLPEYWSDDDRAALYGNAS